MNAVMERVIFPKWYSAVVLGALTAVIMSTVCASTDQTESPMHVDETGSLHFRPLPSSKDSANTIYLGDYDVLGKLRALSSFYQPRLYVLGGTTGANTEAQTLDSVLVMEGAEADSPWRTHAYPLPLATKNAAAAVYAGHLFLLGGAIDGGSSATTDVLMFDGSVWRKGIDLPTPRRGHAAVTYKGELYSLGGYVFSDGNDMYLEDVSVFDGATWSNAAPLPTARNSLAAAVFKGQIYAVGGSDGTDVLNTVEAFDGEDWTDDGNGVPQLNLPRRALGLVVFQDKLYAIGGDANNDLNAPLNTVEVWNGIDSSWSLAPETTTERRSAAFASFNGLLWALGGVDTSGDLATTEAFNGDSWTQQASFEVPMRAHSAAVFPSEYED